MSFKLFTNAVSLSSVDGAKVLRIPIFPISDEPLTHPKAGSMLFDLPFAQKVIANFTAYPGEVPLDFDHGVENASGDGEAIAAGWIKKLVIEGSEVVAYAEPTDRALSKVEAKEYKLSSASLSFDWQNPQNGNHYGPVLLSVALTNRPFIRGLGSVVSIDKGNVSLKDGSKMSMISLADHTKKVEEVTAKLTAAETQAVSLNTQLTEIKVSLADATGKLEKAENQIKELETEKRKGVALSDVEKLITAGKAVPAEKDSLVELHLTNNDLFVKLTKDRPIAFSTRAQGAGGNSERSASDKGKLLVEKANEIFEKEKVEFSDALRIARKRHPELAEGF